MDQRAAEAELLLHAAGQLARRPVRETLEPGAVQQSGDAALAFLPPESPNRRPKKSTFSNTERVGSRFLPNPCGM